MKNLLILITILTTTTIPHLTFAEEKDPSTNPAPIDTTEPSETQNNRAKALEGSASKWSGQLNLNYNGSSINHPFDKTVPNPGGDAVPNNVTFGGTVSARYRFDPTMTVGVNTGVTTEHPFQGPSNTTIADPGIDLAKTFKTAFISHYLDFAATLYTNHQYHSELGYIGALTISDEMRHDFDMGLTLGLALAAEYAFFSDDNKYDNAAVKASQSEYSFVASPYIEYALNKTFNLRSVFNLQAIHTRNISDAMTFETPHVNQTLGLGIAATKSLFLYTYVRFYPFPYSAIKADNTIFGTQLIVNLF